MEAQALGLPVISTYHSGIPEVVEHGVTGVLVPERSVVAIKNELLKLIQNRKVLTDMGKKGREKVESEFDIDALNDNPGTAVSDRGDRIMLYYG
jgi:colanic acid/amylovoran biosynthesis glycosyltransferase